MKKRPRDIPLMNINPEGLRVSMKNGEMVIGARAQFHMVICPKLARFGPKSLFFKNFVRLAPKYIYIVKITFLAQILNVFPLYGWCLPLIYKIITF